MKAILAWLFGFLAPYKREVVFAIVALLIGALSWLALGQGIKSVIDNGFVEQNPEQLRVALVAVLLVALLGSVATYFRFYYMVLLGERVCADIRKQLFAHLLTLSPNFFAQTRTGEVISRFTSDTTLLQSVVGTSVSMTLRSGVILIGALVFMLITSASMTFSVLLAVPLILLPIKLLGKRVRQYAKRSQDDVAGMGSIIDERLHEIQSVQAYSHEAHSLKAFTHQVDAVLSSASSRIHYRALLIALVMFISLSAIFIVAWLGAMDVISGTLSAGELTAFVFYAVLAGGSLATISEVIGELQKAVGASERIIELLATPADIPSPLLEQRSSVSNTNSQQGQSLLTIQELSFAYPSAADKPVLHKINLSVAYGQKTAIVGHSGAGKSTLFDLLMRFYMPSSGEITLAGHAYSSLSTADIRNYFALVPQDAVIFAMSVYDNIAFARPGANEQAVKQAAKLAFADEFIQLLEHGYDTQLGERGVRLSGGQKQRIAIARAILAERPILLLDEATSALDASSERLVKQALDSLIEHTTTIVIAHRLSTVLNADNIIVLDAGQIVAQGQHHELMTRCKTYQEFVALQLTESD